MKQLIAKSTVTIIFVLLSVCSIAVASDPLSSWNEGKAKQAIMDFVARTTHVGSIDYVPPSDRIVVFDNDGTLWVEQPVYTQIAFTIDRVKRLASEHPEWKTQMPYKAVLEGDLTALAQQSEKDIFEMILATHAGMTSEQFEEIVKNWLEKAEHPRFHVPYTQLVYKPMIELIAYLKKNEFKPFIVSGGGVEFMRPWAQKAYGIPPENIIGSTIELKYDANNGKPKLIRLPKVDFIDNGEGKPIGIQTHIGRRPIAAFGNSDGDYEMLDWTKTGANLRLAMLVHHNDEKREYAYDRNTRIGRLNKALDAAQSHGWIVISMRDDWKTIFNFTLRS